ncbi:MAG: hypothetical protein C5B53_04235 [Candidatus Melainabacteria bacterium]|nr:MAG: hypothetical protein C5B53_04235 [Candidatus Melainabacteria bacterium]
MVGKKHLLLRALEITAAVIVILIAWQIASLCFGSERVPSISHTLSMTISSFGKDPIIEAQGGGSGGYSPHVLATLANFMIGFVSGSVGGIIFAFGLFHSPKLLKQIDPLIEFFRVLPPLLVIPFAVIFFRSTDALPSITVGIYTMFTVAIYTLAALRNLPANYSILARFVGATKVRRIIDIQIPAIVPALFGAMRLAIVLGLGISVVAEYLVAPAGIGRVMKFAMSFSRIDLLFVGVVWVILIAVILELLVSILVGFMLKWTNRETLIGID